MTVQGYTPKWNDLNHNNTQRNAEGYALCENCGCAENSKQAADVCWEGPTVKRLRRHVREGLQAEAEKIPQWMKDIHAAALEGEKE